MSDRVNRFKAALAALFAALTTLWGWYGWLVVLWVILMALDVATGMARAAMAGRWSSADARQGIWHKAGSIAAVLVANLLDLAVGQVAAHLPGVEVPFRYSVLLGPLVVVWYILTECGSIVENAGQLGAPIPPWLSRCLERLRDTLDGDEERGEERQ